MNSKVELQSALDNLKSKYGEWTYDIPLPFDIWTNGNLQIPHTRLKRIVQIISDLSHKPLSKCRILDLACLDGIFSIELAKHGADTVGVEIREANINKAIFCKEAIGLDNLEFRQDDVRNISEESYGKFDAIICSGILYHLLGEDAINLIDSMHKLVNNVVVIDTHIALKAYERFVYKGEEYWGRTVKEHFASATKEEKEKDNWASIDNLSSFYFTRPSLLNILNKAGFSSVYECFNPTHLNFGKPGLEHDDRCTFVAIKNDLCDILTSPSVNILKEKWPENSLSYMPEHRPLHKRAISRLKKMTS